MMFASAAPEWIIVAMVAVPNFGVGVLILVFRKRIRLFIKSLVPSMSEDAEFWTSRAILAGGLILLAIPTFLVYSTISSVVTR